MTWQVMGGARNVAGLSFRVVVPPTPAVKTCCLAIALSVLLSLSAPASAEQLSDFGPILTAHDWNGMDCDTTCVAGLKRQHWLALVPGNDGWSLVPTRLSFDEPNKNGVRSSVQGAEFYLAHPALLAGHAAAPDMRFKGRPRAFVDRHASPLQMVFRDHTYEIAIEGHDVVLRSGGRKSVIGGVNEDLGDLSETTLLWAGDLDGDGDIDLIIQRVSAKNGRLCLLLSSANKVPSRIVSDVGCQFFSG